MMIFDVWMNQGRKEMRRKHGEKKVPNTQLIVLRVITALPVFGLKTFPLLQLGI